MPVPIFAIRRIKKRVQQRRENQFAQNSQPLYAVGTALVQDELMIAQLKPRYDTQYSTITSQREMYASQRVNVEIRDMGERFY